MNSHERTPSITESFWQREDSDYLHFLFALIASYGEQLQRGYPAFAVKVKNRSGHGKAD
jgi:hypothetical protein